MAKPKYDVFLSHATPDKPVVEELARILKRLGFEPWLDKWNLVPGEPWQEAIEEALESCATCAVCLGPSGTGPWQNEEMRAAIARRVSDRSRQFRVIPILLPRSERGEPGRLPAFLRATTWVEFRDTLDDEKALHRLISGLRGLPPGPDPGGAVAEGARPYQGLQVFDVGDALFFFGREALTEWLLDKLRDRSGSRFLAIVGPSGSGKSSLARAGLLASLKSGKLPGSDLWPIAICKPGAQPLESLAIALSGAARLGDSPSALRDLIRDLSTDPRMLHLTTRLSLRDAPVDQRLVLLVDQFEEVFTLCPNEAERQAIINNLLHAATAAEGRTLVVLTMRADFYGRCAAYQDLAAAVSDRQSLVGPMTRDELGSAIERPAYLAGCELEGGLADLLLNEVESQPGSLPLLEHALLQIWDRKEGGRRLTIAAYREIGGVAGALEKHAEEVYAGFSDEEKETCRRIFLRLVQVDEQGRATKRRLGLDELAPAASAVETVVSRLTDARLLTTDGTQHRTVEVVHEALFSNWSRFKQWVEQDREALRTRRRLDEAVTEWLSNDRDPSFLYRGARLVQAEEWKEYHLGELRQNAQDFLTASVTERDRERQRQRKWTIAAGVIAAVAIIAAVTALYLRHVAENQRRIAFVGEHSERSRTAFTSNPQLGLLLATQALKMARDAGDPYLPSAQSALRWALAKAGGTPLPSGPVASTLITADRLLLVTVGADRHLRLWDLRAKNPPFPNKDLGILPEGADGLAAPPNGQWLLAADRTGARLLDLRDPGASLATAKLLANEDWIFETQPFSRDGHWLVTRRWTDAKQEEALLLRDLSATDPSQVKFTIPGQSLQYFSFSPDGFRLGAALRDNLIQIWDIREPSHAKETASLPKDWTVQHMAFDSDNQTLIVMATLKTDPFVNAWFIHHDGTIEGPRQISGCSRNGDSLIIQRMEGISLICNSGIWTARSNLTFTQETSWPPEFRQVDFSPDGFWRAMGAENGNLYLHDSLGPKTTIDIAATQAAPTEAIAFLSTNPRLLLTHGGIEAPRIWDLRKQFPELGFEPRVFPAPTLVSVITANGEILAEDPNSQELRLWNLAGQPLSNGLADSKDADYPRALSADGQWVAALGRDKDLLLWQINAGGGLASPIRLAYGPKIQKLQFSPSGHWLAAWDSDDKVYLWDLHNIKSAPYRLTNAIVGGIAFTASEDLIATTGYPNAVHLRTLGEKGPQLADSPNYPKISFSGEALAFSPEGNWLAIGGQDRVQVWEKQGREISLENRSGYISSLAFSPDGHWLAAGGSDGTIQLWRWAEEETNPSPIILTEHSNSVRSLVFTPQGLLSAADDGVIRLWELRTEKLLELACQSAGRTLSKREWANYIPSEPYQDEPCPGLPKAPD